MRQVQIITGGGSGIGLATAAALPLEHVLLLTGRRAGRLHAALRSQGHIVETASCDVSDPNAVEELVRKARSLGQIQSVIHAAGISPGQAGVEEILGTNTLAFTVSCRQWHRVAVSLSYSSATLPGILLPVRSYPLAMKDRDAFLRRCSARCRLIPGERSVAHFVHWYTQRCAYPCARRGVRVVCISPGLVDTDLGRTELENPETQASLRPCARPSPRRSAISSPVWSMRAMAISSLL